MIGFYNYTVILTYMGLASSLIGIYLAMSGSHITMAVIALMISGLCDMFDGKVARTRKRTDDEKKFGIQIDSLCDLICFGLLPAAIGYSVGMNKFYHIAIMIFFTLAALIRLAYFNVAEESRQVRTSEARREYEGLPGNERRSYTSAVLQLPQGYGSVVSGYLRFFASAYRRGFYYSLQAEKAENENYAHFYSRWRG